MIHISNTPLRAGQATLEEDCRQAIQTLRGALIELFASVGADPSVPQEVARQFGVNKNLTWKISKIVAASDALSAIPHIPGSAGLEILLTAFASRGAPMSHVAGVRKAALMFDEVVQMHAGDRAHLDLMLDSMGLLDGAAPLETSREMAFRGNSGIWGIQAKTRMTTGLVVPSKNDPNMVETAVVGGLVGLRRLRRDVSWPLFRFVSYADDGTLDPRDKIRQLFPKDPSGVDEVPTLIRPFCSPKLPEFKSVNVPGGVEYILPSGPVGNTAAFDCFFGQYYGNAARYKTEKDHHGEFASTVSLPVETLVFDVLVHRDLEMPTSPEVQVYGQRGSGPFQPSTKREYDLIPLRERCVELAGSPPVVTTPLIPRYSELLQRIFEQWGVSMSAMRGVRLVLPYPPMGSTVVVRFPLPDAPKA